MRPTKDKVFLIFSHGVRVCSTREAKEWQRKERSGLSQLDLHLESLERKQPSREEVEYKVEDGSQQCILRFSHPCTNC